MSFRPALRNAILINNFGTPHLVDIVAKIIGVCPLIVSYLKETGRKDDGDSLVVSVSSFDCISAFSYPLALYLSQLEEKNARVFLPGPMARMMFCLLHLFLEFCK